MKLKLLEVGIENLKQKQYEALLEHAVAKLNKVKSLLLGGKFEELGDMLGYSAAGNELGQNNYCINFDFSDEKFDDIQDLINKLQDLRFTIYSK